MPERRTDPQPPPHGRDDQRPRTNLTPEKKPYDERYFGSEEEEGVERERQAGEDE